MPLIDDRGRLFGRFNIIDAAIVAFLLVLLPIGFTAVQLFRQRSPQIERVDVPGPGRRISLHGRDFRPFLRVFVSPTSKPYQLIAGGREGTEGIVRVDTPEVMEVELPELADGSYDVYLYDETQEVARRTGAFVLAPEALQAKIRFSVPANLVGVVKAGDADIFDRKMIQGTRVPVSPAVLTAVRVLDPSAAPFMDVVLMAQENRWLGLSYQNGRVIEATVAIPVRRTPEGVSEYGNLTIRTGDPFVFQTAAYSMRGVIDEVAAPSPRRADSDRGLK